MCLSIPARILSIDKNMAKVEIGGLTTSAALDLIEDPQVGDFVLLHTGFAIQKITREEADETNTWIRMIQLIDNDCEDRDDASES